MRYITIGQKVQSRFVNKKQRVVQCQGASNIAVLLFPTLMFATFHNHAVTAAFLVKYV